MTQVLYRPMPLLDSDNLEVNDVDTEEGATCRILITVNTYDDPFTSDLQGELPELIRQFILETQWRYALAYNAGFHGGMKQAKEDAQKEYEQYGNGGSMTPEEREREKGNGGSK